MNLPQAKQNNYTVTIGILFIVVVLLIVFVHITHAVYEGRVFYDHDTYFLSFYHDVLNHSPLNTSDNFSQIIHGFVGYTFYPLVNFMLYLTGQAVPMNLLVYRCFNLLFLALLMWAAYRIGASLADRRAGLLCAIIVATLPIIDSESRSMNVHFHAAAFLLAAHASLLRLLRRPKSFAHYALVGVLCGLAVLTHPISLIQSAVPLGFLFYWTFRHRNLTHKALRIGVASVGLLVFALPFSKMLPGYLESKLMFIISLPKQQETFFPILADWTTDIARGFFEQWFLLLFAGLLAIAIYHVVVRKDHRDDDLFLTISLLFNFLLTLAIRLSGGFTNDVLLFACLVGVLLPAVAWRELQRSPAWQPIVPLFILAIFLTAGIQKSAALAVFSSNNSETFHDSLYPTRNRLIAEPDWFRLTMREAKRVAPTQPLGLQYATNDQCSKKLMMATLRLDGRRIVPNASKAKIRLQVTAHTQDTPWTAREAAHWLTERLGRDPAGYADARWFVKDGDMVTFDLVRPHLLLLIRSLP